MPTRARDPCASPAPAVTLAKSRAPRAGRCKEAAGGHTGATAVPHSPRWVHGDIRGHGGGAGFGYLHKSSCPGRPAAPLGARHVGGGRLPGSCPLSPSPVPCPPPAVQPRGVPSRRCVSQLSSAASEQRRVLDNTPAGRGGLAGVESPRGGKKTHQKNTKKTKKTEQGVESEPGAGALVARRGGAPAPGAAPCPVGPGSGHGGCAHPSSTSVPQSG